MFDSIPFLYEFIWASLGLLLYAFTARVVGYSRSAAIIQQVVLHCLILIKTVNDNIYSMNEIKYDALRMSDAKDEEIRVIKEIDEQTMEMWRTNTIINIVNSFPKEFRTVVGFSTWQQAVAKLERFYNKKGGGYGEKR
jgi:hypothetical protein